MAVGAVTEEACPGDGACRIFRHGQVARELDPGADFSFLLEPD
jgi:hypothetical protein